MQAPHIKRILENQHHFDQVLVMLEEMYNENINLPGGNGRCAQLSRETFKMLSTVVEVVSAIDKHNNSI